MQANNQNNQISQILKRSGEIAEFDKNKIAAAIAKAAQAVEDYDKDLVNRMAEEVVGAVNKKFHQRSIPAVEEIQDIVEEILITNRQIKTAKAYILYRDQHARLRELNELVNSNELMENYIKQVDWRVKENSNMSYSLQGLNNHISSNVSSRYWLNKVYDSTIRDAYRSGDMHIHDLQLLSAYCAGWELKDLLMHGFGGVSGKVESKAPKHFRTALGQIINFFYTLQGEVAGAQAFANFDTYLAPFIRYDNLNYIEVKQALQEFLFNINVPTRVGFQTPFTNLTMDITPSEAVGKEPVIIGGKIMPEKYGDFQPEIDMINIAFAEVMMAGDAKGRVFTFPIPTYNITKEFGWNSPVAEKIFEMTGKYGIPYFSNFINSDMHPDDARSMCPLAGEEKILARSSRGRGVEYSTIKNIYEGNSRQIEYEVYSDGKFIKGKFNKFRNQKMIKVVLENGHEVKMTTKHLNYVLTGVDSKIQELSGEALTAGMYLPYSLKPYVGEGGKADLGYFVGAYAGDGSFDRDSTVVFSLENYYKKELIVKIEKIAKDYFGANSVIKEYKDTKLVSLKIHSQAAVGLCRDFVEGKEKDKRYKARLFTASQDFRKAVLAGHYATDGGNRNRIYTSSPKMVETLNMLAATLGTTTSIYKDNREGRFGKEANYAVLIYQLNRKKYGDVWFKKDSKLWIKIKKIETIKNDTAYCFEVDNGEPMFTIGTTGILTHNCRLRLDNRELKKRGGGLFSANPLTGSVGVVTINMPRLGYLSKTREEYFERLSRVMDIAKESLEIKRRVLEDLTEGGLYPYAKHYLRNIKTRFNHYWQNHFSTIGVIGINESLLNFSEIKDNITSSAGHKFAQEVLDFMRERLMDYQNETNNLFNLEATPGEGTARSLARKDKDRYPDIIVANEERIKQNKNISPYYTNSSQLPVNFTNDIFEALDLQDELQTRYTGGTVLHGFIGEAIPSAEAVGKLVKKIAHSYKLPYFTITPTFSICPKHGYLAGEHHYCPKCDEENGYVEDMNERKQEVEVASAQEKM